MFDSRYLIGMGIAVLCSGCNVIPVQEQLDDRGRAGSFRTNLSVVRGRGQECRHMRSGPSQPRTADEFALGLASVPAQAEGRSSTHRHGEYVRARAAEDDHNQRERVLAARTVAGNARNSHDCSLLLSILGLNPTDGSDDSDDSMR
jgi:hypothetical protein